MDRRTCPGQVTVFLSLVLILVLSLVFTCLESARAEAVRMRFRLAQRLSTESVFAQYDKELWDTFGLLYCFAEGGEASIASEAAVYMEKNASAKGPAALAGTDWMRYTPGETGVISAVRATEQHGAVFRRSVSDYMKHAGLWEAVIAWMKDSGLTGDDGAPTDIAETLGEATEPDLEGLLQQTEELESGVGSAAEDLTLALQAQREEQEMQEAAAPEGQEMQETAAEQPAVPGPALTEEELEQRKSAVAQFASTVRSWIRDGLLSVVIDDVDSVSDTELDTAELPSGLSAPEKDQAHCSTAELTAADDLMMVEYIVRKLDCYTTEGGHGCEAEYVLSGKRSMRDSLASVVKKLIGIRLAADLASLAADPEKTAEAMELGSYLTAWTLNPALMELAGALVVTVWALAEAICDVRALLRGGRLPLIKTSAEWMTSLEHLGEQAERISDRGFPYETYLRILLLVTGREKLAYRTMDMIQVRVRQTEPSFRMDRCIYGAKLSYTGSGRGFFPCLPGAAEYELSGECGFSYGGVLEYI